MKKNLLLLVLLLAANCSLLAQKCEDATAQYELHGNQVRANLLNGGDAFWDLSWGHFFADTSAAHSLSLFSAGLWIGGYDAGGNLHTAVQTYRQDGNDFWPGPIDGNSGTTTHETCNDWDKIWHVSGYEVRQFIADWNDNHIINWAASKNILKYPGRNNPYFQQENGFALPQNQDFAPFFDRNNDGIYNPMQGDYPIVPNTNGTVIADELAWMVYNDEGANSPHNASNGLPFKAEIQACYFSFNFLQPTFLNNTIFAHYKVTNKSTTTYDSTYISLFSDFDIGCYIDDYVGTVPPFNTMYAYNADNDDDVTCPDGSATGFGSKPPVSAATFLNRPMEKAFHFLSIGIISLNPLIHIRPSQYPYMYYGNMSGSWYDGEPYTYGNEGYNFNQTNPINFVFPDNPNDSLGWSMYRVQQRSRDWLMSGSFYLPHWQPQNTQELTVAFSYHRDRSSTATNLTSVDTMYAHLPQLQSFYQNDYTLPGLSQELTYCTSDCVLPGDTNNDGIVNAWDYLYPATSLSSTGLARQDKLNRFIPTSSPNWTQYLANNLDKKHLDCDGNGVITQHDFAIIDQNFGLSRSNRSTVGNPPNTQFFVTDRNGMSIGDSLENYLFHDSIYLSLKCVIPANDFYGAAFTMEVDDSVLTINPFLNNASPLLDYDGYKRILKTYYSPISNRPYKWDIVITEINGLNKGTQNELLRLFIRKDTSSRTTKTGHIDFSNVLIIKNDGTILPYGMKSQDICFSDCWRNKPVPPDSLATSPLDKFSTFPNPVQDNLTVDLVDSDHALLRIFNSMGSLLIEKELKQTRSVTDVSFLPHGIYFVELSNETGKATHRIFK